MPFLLPSSLGIKQVFNRIRENIKEAKKRLEKLYHLQPDDEILQVIKNEENNLDD